MGLFRKSKKYVEIDADDEIVEEEGKKDNASISLGGGDIELKLVKPINFETLLVAIDHLKEGKTVLLNLEHIDKSLYRRMIDFVSGSAYALDATIKQATAESFFIAPKKVDVGGEIFNKKRDEDTFTNL
ncbi:MAG: cell division protein SepF [Clostridia bacterium]|nr:cell division protein SepF [Clostridia bacterium]MBQ8566429.1 cell division protein SepF [Clostridia bacterium]